MMIKSIDQWPQWRRFWNHVQFCPVCTMAMEAQDLWSEPHGLCRRGAGLWERLVTCARVLSSGF